MVSVFKKVPTIPAADYPTPPVLSDAAKEHLFSEELLARCRDEYVELAKWPFSVQYNRDPIRAIMLDLETLDTLPSSVVTQISGVFFNPLGSPGEVVDRDGKIIAPTIDMKIAYKGGHQAGRTISKSTMSWWASLPPHVIEDVFGDKVPRITLEEGLTSLVKFCHDNAVQAIYTHPCSFDMGIIRNAFYETFNHDFPIPFFREMDAKTIETFIYRRNTRREGDINAFGDKHNALHDCVAQILATQNAYRMRDSINIPENIRHMNLRGG